ncbi:hypothetical protein BGX38DRAFT_1278261 [Terfezia claveryi]|nr:hypothetical protein BGX38DRAFT_1278261 [Terfezia claveryi]
MATASANTPPAELEALTPSSLGFPTRGHQRARSVSTGDEGSPNNFVFPRKAPIPGVTHFTRPRSGTTDAITLLAEIGVLPPPGTAAAARLRSPVTPYYPNRQRPVSMLALPTQTLPSVTLASAPAGRTNKRNTSELPDNPIISAAVSKDPPCEEELQVKNATGPPPGYQRRGHAHRRSGAISSSDVWNLLSQSAPSLPLQNGVPTPKADQPPAAPEVKLEAGIASAPRSHHAQKQSWSAPVSPACGAIAIPPSSPTPLDLDKKSSKVAFTERVEIIPRPLSPASPVGAHGGSMSSIGDVVSPLTRNPVTPATPATLGTPTTLATPATPATPVTPGRPRSNTRNRSSSISSSQSPLSPELQAQFAHMTQRPSTAGAVLSPPATPLPPVPTEPVPQVPALRIETAAMPPTPTSPIEPEMPKSPTKFWAPEKSEKPEKEKKARKKSHKKALSDGSPQTSSPSSLELFGNATEKVNKPSSRVKKGDRKKKKHLKNFLFGKGKHEKDGKTGRALKRSPTPPSRHNSFRKQGEMELLPAWTESYVILPEGSLAGRSLEELSSTMSPRYPGSSSDGDSPIIDLDAAMGPFNSPVVGSGSRSSGGFSAAKRRMHSSGAGGKMSIVSGVISNSFAGTHRRSESMPEMGMPLFDLAGHAGMEMEDVFEEDEEDEEESSSGSDSGSETDESEDGDRQRRLSAGGLGIGIQVIDGDGVTTWEEGISVDWNNVPRGPRRSSLAPTLGSNGSLKNASIQEEDEPEEDTTATRPTSLFYQNNDSAKSQSPSPDPCSTPTSLVPSTQSSTSTVTPTSAVSTASTLPDTPATSCPSESMSMNMPLPSPSFAAPKTTSPGSRRNSLSLKELVDLSLQEGSGFDPYADSEFQFLGEPGPEMRMSVSVEDVPSLTSSSSTMTSSYAAYCAAGILQQPSTPKIEEIPVGAVGSGVSVASVKGKDKDRGLKKKWSRVFKFWESEEKEQAHKEKKDKEHHGKDKVKEKEEKSLKKEKTHKKEEKMQKEKREKKGKAKICKEVGKKERI